MLRNSNLDCIEIVNQISKRILDFSSEAVLLYKN